MRRIQKRPVTRFTVREARSIMRSEPGCLELMYDTPMTIRVPTQSEINPEEKLK